MPSVFGNIDVDEVNNNTLRTIWTNLAQYERTFGKHAFNLFAGLEFTREHANDNLCRTRGVDITQYPLYIIKPSSTTTTIINKVDYRKLSEFASLKYVFDDRYILSGTIRRDGSSRFGPQNKYGYFPSASLAWNVNRENFFSKLEVVSNMKLRASWGVNGNDLISNYLYLSSFVDQTNGNVVEFANYDINGSGIGAQTGILQMRQANPDIKWESTTQYNAGVDLGFLQNRLTLVFDVFDKRTKNLLLQPIAQAILGEASSQTIKGRYRIKVMKSVLGIKGRIQVSFVTA